MSRSTEKTARATTALDPTLARQRAVILSGLIAVTVVAWLWVIHQAATGMPMETFGLGLTMGMGAWALVVMWTVMMVGMMFPASAPMILTFSAVQARHRAASRPYASVSVFTASYMLVWVAFGALALSVAAGVDALAERSTWLTAHWQRIAGALIVIAGAYQFTPLKDVCLRRCRSPISFLLTYWQDGWRGAFALGLRHGIYCAGCCWLLFVILVPLGIMNLIAMGAVTAVVFAEKTLPGGRLTAQLAGAVLVIYGMLVLVFPGALPA